MAVEDGCLGPGLVADATDCRDADPAVNPAAPEVCDAIDDDCDHLVDDADPSVDPATRSDWYADADHDGAGDAATVVTACKNPTWYVANPGDCDDADPAIGFPVSWRFDADGDGFGAGAASPPGCAAPAPGYVASALDCDDASAATFPGAIDTCADGVDQDCDGGDAACHLPLASPFDLETAEVIRRGTGPSDALGQSPSILPDLDGDGRDELAFGARQGNGNSADVGFVEYGPPRTGTSRATPVITGVSTNSVRTLRGLGDIDGDGLGDVAATGELSRTTWILDGPVAPTNLVAGAVASIDADDSFVVLGPSLAAPGDVDGDGLADLAIGGLREDPDGMAVVFEGPLVGPMNAVDAVASFPGDAIDHDFGAILASGDLDGDGLGDLAIGTTDRASTGGDVAFAYHAPFAGKIPTSAADTAWLAAGVGAHLSDVAIAGDVDGDGSPDLAISDREYDGGRGRIYVVDGDASGIVSVATAFLTLDGVDANDHAGADLGFVGDVDQDGLADVIVGTSIINGSAYLVPGGTSGVSLLGTVGVEFTSAWANEVGGGGDLDGDGYPDLVFGAPNDDRDGLDSGRVYVVFGGPF